MSDGIVRVNFSGFDRLKIFLRKIKSEEGDFETLQKRIGFRITNTAIPDHFEKKESPEGEKWADLSDDYKKRKLKKKGTLDILKSRGNLFESIGFRYDSTMLVIGAGNSDVKYAATHNFGDKKRNIPKREFIGLGKQENEIIEEEILRWISQ
ncbi:MAG TPA: phage virion morphogenesis protein [Spirochaetota bacterium]|nr:phage virion morphogenesis protein [Spirochaetota bacterium]